MSIEQRVAAGDITLFDHIESESSLDDRRSLLALQHAAGETLQSYVHLEIGSHLGGTLQPFVADPRCRRVISIDPRPEVIPDDRGRVYEYPGNSTQRMLDGLQTVPGADLDKLDTIEASTEDIAVGRLIRPDLCVIDGEHTFTAALRDARFCRAASHGAGILVFHDRAVVHAAIARFVAEVPGPRRVYALKGRWYVVELGLFPSLLQHPAVADRLAWSRAAWRGANRLRLAATTTRAFSFVRGRR